MVNLSKTHDFWIRIVVVFSFFFVNVFKGWSFCSSDPGQNLSDLDPESNPNQYQMACWAGIVTYFDETILLFIFSTSECTKFGVTNLWQTVTKSLSHILQWYSISKQLEPNPNNILSEHSIDFDRTILFFNFLTSGWTKSDVTNV